MSEYQPNGKDSICTVSGRWVRPLDPERMDIDIMDIAHSLANQCRFTGHTRQFYSTAQHSVYVSAVCESLARQRAPRGLSAGADIRERALAGLLHDASEAYIADIARPLKRADEAFATTYQRIETDLQKVIFAHFGLRWPMPNLVHEADDLLLWAEMRDLMPNDPPEGVEAWPHTIHAWEPTMARHFFMRRFQDLTEQYGDDPGGN